MRTPQFRVVKRGNKRASKVFNDATQADTYAKSAGPEYRVDVQKGEPIRCTGDYCNVSAWCSQYQRWKDTVSAPSDRSEG